MSRKKKVLSIAGVLLIGLLAYLFLWPVPIDPAPWTPPKAPPLEGPYARNQALAEVHILGIGGRGPEDVEIDSDGRIYGGLHDGRIMRMKADGSELEQFCDTGGRPLGMEFDAAGNLIVADADKGLLSVDPSGNIEVLSTEHDGRRFGFADDVDVATDGTIYFSDASTRWDRHHVREAVFDHRPNGRLLSYDPASKRTEQLLDQLYFANGVAVAEDESYVLVCETTRYRVQKLWLSGEKRGQTEVLIDNLPGMPDGISRGHDGVYWVALYTPRIEDLDRMLPRPWLRRVVYRLPLFVQPDAPRHAFVLGVREDGKVVANMQHAGKGSFSPITSVEQAGELLYLGSLEYPGVARIAVPAGL